MTLRTIYTFTARRKTYAYAVIISISVALTLLVLHSIVFYEEVVLAEDHKENRFIGYRALCDNFFTAAKCDNQLAEKGNRHRLPSLDSLDDFHCFQRVLLIIHYNDDTSYDSAAKVYEIYENLFAKIVFCGPSENETAFWPRHPSTAPDKRVPASTLFVPYGKLWQKKQLNPYLCLPLVLQSLVYFNQYEGVLAMSDDVVLNYWNWKLAGKSLDKVWILKESTEDHAFDIDTGVYCDGKSINNSVDCITNKREWIWPKLNKPELAAFYANLEGLTKGSLSTESIIGYFYNRNFSQWLTYWQDIKYNLTEATKGPRRLLGDSNADLFYIPQAMLENAAPIFHLIGKHKIFLEIAVVTGLRCVASPGEIQLIDFAGEDWGQGHIRSKPFIDSYSTRYEMVHPLKLRFVTADLLTNFPNFKSDSTTLSCVYCNLVQFATKYANLIK